MMARLIATVGVEHVTQLKVPEKASQWTFSAKQQKLDWHS